MSGTGDERDLLAAEYVLGTLSPSAARQARTLIESDPALAAAVQQWQTRLSPLAATVAPVPPPAALWSRIEASLAPPAAVAIDLSSVARPTRVERPPSALGRAWRSPAAWRAATVGSLALAASLAGILVLRAPQPAVLLVASLAPLDSKPPAFLAQLQAGGAVVMTAVEQVAVEPGKDLELWLARPGGKPQSLGLLPSQGKQFTLPAIPPTDSKLLVSLEPAGGSPTGAPTGKVLYGGTLVSLRSR